MSTKKAREERDRVWAATYASYFTLLVYHDGHLEGPTGQAYEEYRRFAAEVADEAVKGYYGRSMRYEEEDNG